MKQPSIIVAGIGPGGEEDITAAAAAAIARADVIVGYKYYFRFIEPYRRPDSLCIDTGMKKERERAEEAFRHALQGKTVCVISSGDAGIYGMASLIWEMKKEKQAAAEHKKTVIEEKTGEKAKENTAEKKETALCPEDPIIETVPGISAFQKAASLLGAPVGHDFCVISLSDLMTPWEMIEKRIKAAAAADFITAVYNPRSAGRYWQLYRLKELFLKERGPGTPVGYVRQAGRPGQQVTVTTLEELDPEQIDMFTVLLIGNSQSYCFEGKFITPRGYYREANETGAAVGQDIMIRSFRTIEKELKNKNIPLDRKWALLHAIHTTADFEMENLLYTDPGAVSELYRTFNSGACKTIITDVTMAAAGIRKGALQRMGIAVKCYLADCRIPEICAREGITRTQAGIRLAVEEHPDALFVFGNAPTALMELCSLVRKGTARPQGIIAAPVGFVHVEESKHMVKPFTGIPKLIVEGRKGGSNLAATLVNAVLCYDDAQQLRPGRDV